MPDIETSDHANTAGVPPPSQGEAIVRIPLTDLHPFPTHPYGIRDDPAMQDTADSVKANGVVVPVSQCKTNFHAEAKPFSICPFAEVPTFARRGAPQRVPPLQTSPRNLVASVGTFAEVNTGKNLCFQGF